MNGRCMDKIIHVIIKTKQAPDFILPNSGTGCRPRFDLNSVDPAFFIGHWRFASYT